MRTLTHIVGQVLLAAGQRILGQPEKRIPGDKWFPAWRLLNYRTLRMAFQEWTLQQPGRWKNIRAAGFSLQGLPSAQNLDKISQLLGIPKEVLGWQIFDIGAIELVEYGFYAPHKCPPAIREAVLSRGYSPEMFLPKEGHSRIDGETWSAL
ncbi:MAG: hypothetical protein GX410_11105 [Elusimicrobia bacterium]|nr:hypothetical protein [Elusimicrobiota bacterium]